MAAVTVALCGGAACLVVAVQHGAFFQAILRATVGAAGRAGAGNVQEDAGVHAPQRRFRAGAENGQVFCADFNDFVSVGDGGRSSSGHGCS